MQNITDIKRRIMELGPAEFQEFCDTFLFKKGYGNVHGYGMKAGTGKTTTGNPDTYFRKESGKYVFVAYTMQEHSIYAKLKEDIDKCLDESKTGVKTSDIEEIVCCHISSNLSAGNDKKLHHLCESKGIKLTIYGIDEMANQILSNYRSMAKDFLGLSIDTNQILMIDEFVTQCDANGMSAPLNTTFQFRSREKDDIEQLLLRNSVVIVTGRAGVGKTRLVLETIKDFSLNYGYKVLCVKNKNLGIYEDLVSATEHPGKYLFFIDDANELADIKQILSYITKDYLGYDVKVIATVRDYAKTGVITEAKEYVVPSIVQIEPFSEDEISSFLEKNLGIKNRDYVEKIVEIAEGNPRIAYMAGKLAIEEESLSAIYDVSQLYEAYYKRHVDATIGKDQDLCFAAGILAVINAVMLNNLTALQDTLNNYGITEERFKEKIQELSQLEVVEIHLDQVATLSDQCLANYMLYYVFFQRKLFSLEEILETGYKHFRNGVIRSLNTILNLFVNEETKEYCRQEVLKVWDKFKKTEDAIYYKFVEDFHIFRPEEGFLLASDWIKRIEPEEILLENVDYNKSHFGVNDSPLKLLQGYKNSEYIDYVIEILLDYCARNEATLVTGYKWLEDNYGIEVDSYKYKFFTQKKVADVLTNFILQGNTIAIAVGVQWAKYALGFNFRPSEVGRGGILRLYHFDLEYTEGVDEYRAACWDMLIMVAQNDLWRERLIGLIETYSRELYGKPDRVIVENDKQNVEELLGLLACDRVCFLRMLERLLLNAEKNDVHYDEKWKKRLCGPLWNFYKLLEDEFVMSNLSYEEYQAYRESRLQKYGKELSKEKVSEVITATEEILSDIPDGHDAYTINRGLELIVKEFDTALMQEFFDILINRETRISIHPCVVLDVLNKQTKSDDLLKRLKESTFSRKNEWLFAFFETLPCERVNDYYFEEFMEFLKSDEDKSIKESSYRNLRVLDKFLKIRPDIYPTACEIIYKKREYSPFIAGIYLELLFHKQVFSPEELLVLFEGNKELLQDIYFYSLSIGRLEDYTGEFLREFIRLDESWLKKYANVFWHTKSNDDYNRNGVLWESDNYIKYYDYLFDSFPNDDMYDWEICNKFKNVLVHSASDDLVNERQKEWLIHLIQEKSHSDKIDVIFDLLCELNDDLRRAGIETFLQTNDDYDVFDRLRLLPNHWSGTDSFVPAYQRQIDFLESLYPLVSGVKYLKHKIRIQKDVDMLKDMIKHEEIEVIYRHLYM